MSLPPSLPVYFLANAHFVLAGPILGLVGAAVLRLHGGTSGFRPALWVVGAKALSTVLLIFPLSVAFTGLLPQLLGEEPLGRLPWLVLSFGAMLFLASSLFEWPFFHRAVARGGKVALRLSLRANAVCLLALVAIYLPFCRLSLLGAERGVVTASEKDGGTQVFYLREGTLFRRVLGGPEVALASGFGFGDDARVFAKRGELGWDLWLQERDLPARTLQVSVASDRALAPQQTALQVKLKKSVRTVEPALFETFGKPAEVLPEFDSPWDVRLSPWPREGLRVESRDLRGGYDLALDTPLLSWDARCGTRLPGERVLFQMGPYLWLLDLETRRLQRFAKGQGAQVILAAS